MPHLVFILKDGTRKRVSARAGQSVMAVARRHRVDIEGACEGCMACATCHVHVDPEWAAKLTPPGDQELDLLELAAEPCGTSRLGCQIIMNDQLDELIVALPKGPVPNLLL